MSFTGLGFRIFGVPFQSAGMYAWEMGSRIVLTSDVMDVAREFQSVCDRVVVQKNRHPHDADARHVFEERTHDALDLEGDPSNHDLESIEVLGFTNVLPGMPVIVATFGRKRPAALIIDDDVIRNSQLWMDARDEDRFNLLNRLGQAANNALVSISRSGHRILSFQRRNRFAYNTISVLVFAAWVYTAVQLWPNWITAGLLFLMLIPLQSLRGRLDEPMRRYFGLTEDNASSHIVVRAQTREEWRKQRFNSRRDIWVAILTFISSILLAWSTDFFGLG